MKRMKNNEAPLIIEDHPEDYDGYPFITLIQQVRRTFLTIVDNMERNSLGVFVLDLCAPEQVDEKRIVELAAEWYEHNRKKYPVSIEFSKNGLTIEAAKIYRTFNAEYITRIIGPVPKFPMSEPVRVRRRKKKLVPPGVGTHNKISFYENVGCSMRGKFT